MRALASFLIASLGAASAIFACSTTDGASLGAAPDGGAALDGSGGGEAGEDARTRVAPPPLPLLPNNGGPIVASPEVITITWSSDPIAVDLEAFDDWMVPSAFWKTLMAEWGVGPGTHGGSYRIPTPPPATIDDSDVKPLIEALVAAGHVPPPNGSRIFAVYPPAGTAVTSFGEQGCTGFQAYHSSFAYAGKPDAGGPALAIFAITPRCENNASGLSPLDYVTWGQSHEIMEAASDPSGKEPAWVILRQSVLTPETGENADLCTGHPTIIEGHEVTRNWSNAAAAKGERPCVPAPAGPMFGAFVDGGEVTVAAGSSLTTKLRLYATADMPAFKVRALAGNAKLSATIAGTGGNDGDELEMTIQASADYAGVEGQNLIYVYALSKDYLTRRAVIVHAK